MQASRTQLAGTSRLGLARRYGLAGLGLFFFGFALGGVGNSAISLLWITPYADTLTALGFVFSLFGAVRAGSSTREIIIAGIIFGNGTFYLGEPHLTHIESGIGLGFDHVTHVFVGLGLIAAATAVASLLSFYHRRRPRNT